LSSPPFRRILLAGYPFDFLDTRYPDEYPATEVKEMNDSTGRLVVKIGRTYRFIHIDEIDCLEAEGNYLRLHMGDKSHLIRHTLSGIEAKLDPRRFVRINRSTIVNVDRIRELRTFNDSRLRVILRDDRSWNWGRRYRHNLVRLIEGDRAG